MDFGLARCRTHAEGGSEFLERGLISGTLQYMAPEQAEGSYCTERTDLYNLGVVLYELCTGCLPLRGDSVMQLIRALALEIPRTVRDFTPAIPVELEALIMQMLAKDPARRPASAEEVERRLSDLQERLRQASTEKTPILGQGPESPAAGNCA
jgi:serine/threonine-protein kinase